jgi:hypothetical protein
VREDYAREIFSKRIAWLLSSQLKMSFNVTGYIDVNFEDTKIQNRDLSTYFFGSYVTIHNILTLKNRLFANVNINKKK